MKNLTWPQVAAVVAALATVATLAVLHVDTTAIVTLVIALLLGGVAGTVNQVRDNTNGNNRALLDANRELARYLAQSPPVQLPPADPPATTEGDGQKTA